jgi:gamma-carbonic anhydrase
MTQYHGNILPYKGKWPKIADDVFIAPGASVIGDVEIGAGSSIWFNCVLRGDDNPIRIGERVNVQDGTVIHVHSKFQGTFIGNDITIGHMALLHACTLEDKCFVGMGSIVLDQCTVETHGMLAGGAMLTPGKTVTGGEMWGGRPAKPMRALSDEEIANFDWSVAGYCERAGEFRDELAALADKHGVAAE